MTEKDENGPPEGVHSISGKLTDIEMAMIITAQIESLQGLEDETQREVQKNYLIEISNKQLEEMQNPYAKNMVYEAVAKLKKSL